MGKPLVVKRWPGTEHVNVFENVLFLESDSFEEIRKKLLMARVGLEDGVLGGRARRAAKEFKYSYIAQKAIGTGSSK